MILKNGPQRFWQIRNNMNKEEKQNLVKEVQQAHKEYLKAIDAWKWGKGKWCEVSKTSDTYFELRTQLNPNEEITTIQ